MNDSMLLVGKIGDGDHDLRPQNFMHPKHERDCCYLVGTNNVYEIQSMEDEGHCSLFIDDFVSESDTIYVVSRMDPIFLLIPSLLRNRKKSQISDSFCSSPLDQLLPDTVRRDVLSKLESPAALEAICKIQEIDDEIYCVLSDEKVVEFLDSKLAAITEKMTDSKQALQDALCVLNEYIPSYFFEKLCDRKKLSAKRVLNPRKRKHEEAVSDDGVKKRKVDERQITENMNRMNVHHDEERARKEAKPKVKASPRPRSIANLSKADTSGMKSMMNYFKKAKK